MQFQKSRFHAEMLVIYKESALFDPHPRERMGDINGSIYTRLKKAHGVRAENTGQGTAEGVDGEAARRCWAVVAILEFRTQAVLRRGLSQFRARWKKGMLPEARVSATPHLGSGDVKAAVSLRWMADL